MLDETLDVASDDLAQARGKIEATRAALQAALDAQEGDVPEIRLAIARLERIAAEAERIEFAVRDAARGPVETSR